MQENDYSTATSAVAAGYMDTQACLIKMPKLGFEMGHGLPYVVQLQLQFVAKSMASINFLFRLLSIHCLKDLMVDLDLN